MKKTAIAALLILSSAVMVAQRRASNDRPQTNQAAQGASNGKKSSDVASQKAGTQQTKAQKNKNMTKADIANDSRGQAKNHREQEINKKKKP